jgi:hypothetical protein
MGKNLPYQLKYFRAYREKNIRTHKGMVLCNLLAGAGLILLPFISEKT